MVTELDPDSMLAHGWSAARRWARAAAVVVIAVALGGALVAGPASAATEEEDAAWGVQPGTPNGPDAREAFDYQVAPGTVISDWVSVTNSSTKPLDFRVVAEDATTDYDSGAFTLVGTDVLSTDVGAWTSVDGAASTCPDVDAAQNAACLAGLGIPITLGPGERANIPFTVNVPHDATPGDHVGGIAAIYTTGSAGAGISTPVAVHAGARIYVRVDGALDAQMGVTGLVSGYDGSWNPFVGGTGRIGFDVANTGNVRLSAQPQATLTGPFGIGLGEWSLPVVANVMPGGTAHVEAELDGVPPLFLLFADLTLEPIAGSGVANASDTLPETMQLNTVAWAVPWVWVIAVVVIGGGVALFVWQRRRRAAFLNDDLAAYREQVLAEDRAARGTADAAPAELVGEVR